jgi:hypothetical protein
MAARINKVTVYVYDEDLPPERTKGESFLYTFIEALEVPERC